MGTLSISSSGVPSAQYGYQVILGLGIGTTISLLIVTAPTVVEEKDTSICIDSNLSCMSYRVDFSSIGIRWRIDTSPGVERKY